MAVIWFALAAWIAAPLVALAVAAVHFRREQRQQDRARGDVGCHPRPHVGLDVEQVDAINAQRMNPRRLGRWDGNPRV